MNKEQVQKLVELIEKTQSEAVIEYSPQGFVVTIPVLKYSPQRFFTITPVLDDEENNDD